MPMHMDHTTITHHHISTTTHTLSASQQRCFIFKLFTCTTKMATSFTNMYKYTSMAKIFNSQRPCKATMPTDTYNQEQIVHWEFGSQQRLQGSKRHLEQFVLDGSPPGWLPDAATPAVVNSHGENHQNYSCFSGLMVLHKAETTPYGQPLHSSYMEHLGMSL